MTTIRPAERRDAQSLARLAAETFVETFGHLYRSADLRTFLEEARSEAAYARLLADADVFAALASADDGGPVGYVVAGRCRLPVPALEPGAGEVRELYVLASHQGRRLGSQLLETALDWLDERGYSPLYVGVFSENDGAQRLYGRYGFDRVGEYDFPVGEQLDREFILKRTPEAHIRRRPPT